MSLSAHQRLDLRRRFPDATIEESDGRVALVFPCGSFVFGHLMVGQWSVSVSITKAAPQPGAVIGARDELRRILC